VLTLAEGLVLLALDDEHGTVGWRSGDALDLGLAGALLADLALRQRIGVEGRTVTLLDPAPAGELLLDEALALIAGSTKERDAQGWVNEAARHVKHLRDRLCEGLVAQGILRREQHTTLLVFHRARYPSDDSAPEQALRAELQAAARVESPIEPRLRILLSLARACELLNELVARDARKQVAALVKGEPWGEAVGKAIQERRAALIAATTTASTVN
jgi:hypothetical protein